MSTIHSLPSCLFCKIASGAIPVQRLYEDDNVLAFPDINPQAPVHVLVIPKGEYVSLDDFTATAPDAAQAAFLKAVGKIARDLGLAETGYRILANHGVDAHQEVAHFHVHIFGGKFLGRMLPKS